MHIMSLRKSSVIALSLVSSLQLLACGPQQTPSQSRSPVSQPQASSQSAAAGLRPAQPVAFQPGSGFRTLSQAAAPRVLMVISQRDFWYADYALTRQALEALGVQVTVAAESTQTAYPHWNSGEGSDQGAVTPDLGLLDAQAADYDAIVFVGGWGASAYQYGFSGTYHNSAYNGSPVLRQQANQLINDFLAQDKYVTALCHGVTVLAWARVNGVSPLAGRQVTGWNGPAPAAQQPQFVPQARWQIESNGAEMLPSGAIGDPAHATDDVMISGRIITAEDARSASAFGQILAERLLAETAPVTQPTPAATTAPSAAPSVAPSPSAPAATPEPSPLPTALPTAEPTTAPTVAAPLPVLLVIANQDFYYREYAEPRAELLAAGIPVVVAAEHVQPSYPHPDSGQGSGSGEVMPDIRLDQALAGNYSAIVFVGGWGSSQYQYAFPARYSHQPYNGNTSTKAVVNQLINDFAAQNKYVMGICHGASVLAWARINGSSPLAGRRATGGPHLPHVLGQTAPWQTRDYIVGNGGIHVPSRSVGNPSTSADDLVIDGRFITAEDYDTAQLAGQTLAQLLLNP